MKRYCSLFIVLFCFFSCCQKAIAGRELEVVVTVYPLYAFARQVGGDNVSVSMLLPPGVEAHAFEPRPKDIVRINDADVFIYTGKSMEPWAGELLTGIANSNLLVVDVSKELDLEEAADAGMHKGHTKKHHDHAHGLDHDPHIWLDFGVAKEMVMVIAEAFCEKDPQNKVAYKERAIAFNNELQELDDDYYEALKRCQQRIIVYGGHFAFGRLAERYELEYRSPYTGFAPDTEPSLREITEIIKMMQKTRIKYIYYEELIEPRVAQTIAEETGAQMLLLHGAHNVSKKEMQDEVSFIKIMQDNLEQLKIGLGYKE